MNLRLALKSINQLKAHYKIAMGEQKANKAYFINGYYYWSVYNPKWPSKAFNTFIATELESLIATNSSSRITTSFLAFTKKCPLNCEHCSEWPTLDNKELLSLEEWKNTLDNWVSKGVGQLIYAGGEPLSRFNDLLVLINRYQGVVDQWIYTSGFGLTMKKAIALKNAGIDGVAISIDNHIADLHNTFRRNSNSFQMACDAVLNCQKAGIIISINICPTRKYVNDGQLTNFMKFAKQLDVPFVHIMEPRAIGNYKGMDVEFTLQEKTIVENLFHTYNFTPEKKNYPIIIYPPLVRKRTSCRGGNSFILIDYDGSIKNCPFCKKDWTLDENDSACSADSILEKEYETH